MFSSRKPLDAPPKRANALLTSYGSPVELTLIKRQRLDDEMSAPPRQSHAKKPSALAPARSDRDQDQGQDRNVLADTAECTVARLVALPPMLSEDLRGESLQPAQIVSCRVSVPATTAMAVPTQTPMQSAARDRRVATYFVCALRHRMVLWQEGSGSVVTLALPEEVARDDVLAPFLFSLYGARISLMVVGRSGLVLFWEDIHLPYESVPLSVQIPLQPNEFVVTSPHASILSSSVASLEHAREGGSSDDSLRSILCWSNQGSIWEVAMEDRRIRVRSFERQQDGFLSGLTKTVTQFFFAGSNGDVEASVPIRSVRLVPSEDGDRNGLDATETAQMDMLVLLSTGAMERRAFNVVDAVDCTSPTLWRWDANRAAITYFSEHFPNFHLAKVVVISMPFVLASGFGLLVAYVCSARNQDAPKIKYALLFCNFGPSRFREPAPEWGCLLDYEPSFSEAVDSSEYLDVDSFLVTRSALYLVWAHSQPVRFSAIQLPSATQTSINSKSFSVQGVSSRSAFGFGPRAEPSKMTPDALSGSISFVLLDAEKSSAAHVCAVTASNMTKLSRRPIAVSTPNRRNRVDEERALTEDSHVLGENLSVEEYAQLLMGYFQEHTLTSGCVRVRTRDVTVVAKAAVAVAYQILDAKASSGLRWGKDANDDDQASHRRASGSATTDTLVTPKLVRYQLEEKRSLLEEFLSFLQQKCSEMWHVLEESTELMQYLVEGEEKLHAAISLCTFQGAIRSGEDSTHDPEPKITGQLLLQAIDRTVEERGYKKDQLRLAGYNSFDIFYCEVSKIDELFGELCRAVQNLASSAGEGNLAFLYGLLESGYCMQSLLKAPTSTRLQCEGRWMFTRDIREKLAEHIVRLSAAIGYLNGKPQVPVPLMAEEVFEVTDQIQRLGKLLLDAYVRFIPTTVVQDVVEELQQEVNLSKRIVLNPLVFVASNYEFQQPASSVEDDSWRKRKQADAFEQCIALAEKYSYYEAMVYLAYYEDKENLASMEYALGRSPKSAAAKRLEKYLRTQDNFADFVYRWYGEETRFPWEFSIETARSRMFAFLLSNPSMMGPSLHVYLKSSASMARYSWLTAVSSNRFDQACSLSLHEAKSEHSSLARRKTMASIAKLSVLAGEDSQQTEPTVVDIQRELRTARIQETLAQMPIPMGLNSAPLSQEKLVDATLGLITSLQADHPLRSSLFLMVLEALECFPEDSEHAAFEKNCIDAWRKCVLVDQRLWAALVEEATTSVNEHKLEQLMHETLVFQVIIKYREQRAKRRELSTWMAGLTVERIDALVLVQHEEDVDSVINMQTRQLLIKTLNLAQASNVET